MERRIKNCWCGLLFAVLGLLGQDASAMRFEVQGKTLFASGAIEGNEWNKFKELLEANPIERVVFVNSPGGDLWTGMRVGRLLAERKLQTVVVGACSSSCSIMFMGGSDRRFSDLFAPGRTYVGFHGPHNKTTKQVDRSLAGQMYAFFALRMGDRFNSELINTALFEMDDADAMLYVYDPVRSPARAPTHCRSGQLALSACVKKTGTDALSMGLITDSSLVSLRLPEAMIEETRIPGGVLQGETVDATTLFPDLAKTRCKTDTCTKAVTDFPDRKSNRAIAFPLEGSGYGGAWGKDTTGQAFISALYSCNHIKERPSRLCQVRVVNDVDVRADSQNSVADHEQAIRQLQLPGEKFFNSEQYGGGFTKFSELRIDKVVDATPQELPNVQTLGTQAMAQLLLSDEAPVVIDVTGADKTIPTGKPLLYGGTARANPDADGDLAKRIGQLLKLLSPEPARKIVFVGYDHKDWRGVNAAIRATTAGFSNVAWYRGGLSAWKAANLPVARANFQAVAD